MSTPDNLLLRLKTLQAQGASGIATRGGLAAQASAVGGAGVAAGRIVYDSVTGQRAEVIASTIAYLPAAVIEELSHG